MTRSFFLLLAVAACSPQMPAPLPRAVTPEALLAGGDCPAPTGPGTPHTTPVMSDETWTAAASPHLVSSLRLEATVTLEPCAVVLMKKEASLSIGNSGTGRPGKLVAAGTLENNLLKPVIIKPEKEGERWAALFVQETGSLDLAFTAVSGGGNKLASSSNAAIEARGTQTKPLQQKLRLRQVAVLDSGAQGITLRGYSAFTSDSTGLFIRGSGAETESDARFPTGFPLDIEPGGVGTIPEGSQLTGNRRDAIIIRSVTRLAVDETFPNRGVPYHVQGDFLMYDLGRTPLTLRIEAGVTMRFEKQGSGNLGLTLGDKSSMATVRLVAQGTAEKPILLTSAQPMPSPGDWKGVYFSNGPATGNVFEHVTVEYAGGATGARGFGCGPGANVGGLLFIDWRPQEAFVKNSTFRNTIGAGVVSGWTSDETGPDFAAGNSFSNIVEVPMEGRCNVTRWKPMTGFCASPGPTCVQ